MYGSLIDVDSTGDDAVASLLVIGLALLSWEEEEQAIRTGIAVMECEGKEMCPTSRRQNVVEGRIHTVGGGGGWLQVSF